MTLRDPRDQTRDPVNE